MAVKKIYTDLEVYGTGSFTGIVSGIAGVAAADFVTKGQVEGYGYIASLSEDVAPAPSTTPAVASASVSPDQEIGN